MAPRSTRPRRRSSASRFEPRVCSGRVPRSPPIADIRETCFASGLPSRPNVFMRYGWGCRISGSVPATAAPERVVIVTVARITRRKGHPVTLAALSTLPRELRRRITWLVIGPDGEDDYVRQLKRLVATVDCDIRFLGAMPDAQIRDIYGAADFFCLTGVPESSGRVEGFGLVYLEAAAGGLPSVATAIGGVPDAGIPAKTGLL